MTPRFLPAVFMRGGTSKAVIFHARDLPAERSEWDALFLAALGSPDPYGRQLDGMGGGLSSLSKVCVVAPSIREDADVDYTFAQVLIREPRVDYRGNCGNMLAAIGPFAVDEGLVAASGDTARVRIHNTNTGKIIHSTFPLDHGRARVGGDLAIPGVAGSGAPIRLDFVAPGGATTGRLLPTGRVVDVLDVPGLGRIEASLVDAGNACVFVRAADLGLSGSELPDRIEAEPGLLDRLQAIRVAASVAMGIAPDEAAARAISTVPYIGWVAAPADAPTLAGAAIAAADVDLTVRMISNGQAHRALPLTASLCTAVAARLDGSLPAAVLPSRARGANSLRLGMPSGILTVGADVVAGPEGWHAKQGAFFRTARRLFDGRIHLPG